MSHDPLAWVTNSVVPGADLTDGEVGAASVDAAPE